MLELLRRHRGLSKAAALQEIAQLDSDALRLNLATLRHVERKRLAAEQGSTAVDPSPADGVSGRRDHGDPAPVASRPTSRTKKVPYTLLLPPAMLDELKALSDEDGAPVSHHIRQAINRYLRRARNW